MLLKVQISKAFNRLELMKIHFNLLEMPNDRDLRAIAEKSLRLSQL